MTTKGRLINYSSSLPAPEEASVEILTDESLEALFLLLDMALESVSSYKLSIAPFDFNKRDPDGYTKMFGIGKYVQIQSDKKDDEPAVFFMYLVHEYYPNSYNRYICIDFDRETCPEKHWDKVTKLAGTTGQYYEELDWEFLHYFDKSVPVNMRSEYYKQVYDESVDLDVRKKILANFIKEVLDRMYLSPLLPPYEGLVFFNYLPHSLSYYISILDEAIKAVSSKNLILMCEQHGETNTHEFGEILHRRVKIHNDNTEDYTVFDIYFAYKEDDGWVSNISIVFKKARCLAEHWNRLKSLDGTYGKYYADFYFNISSRQENEQKVDFDLWKKHERHFYVKNADRNYLQMILTGFIDEVVGKL